MLIKHFQYFFTIIFLMSIINLFGQEEKNGEKYYDYIENMIRDLPNDGETLIIDDMLFSINKLRKDGAFDGTPWPDGKVYYKFHTNVTEAHKDSFRVAYQEWENSVPNLEFIEVTEQVDNYIIVHESQENSSSVGMIGGPQDLNIYNWGYRFIIAHEIGHALGAIHEHQRSDRGKFVIINWDNIPDSVECNFVITPSSVNRSAYDYKSVMHYGAYYFSSNGEKTIEPLITTMIGQRDYLSDNDIEAMNIRYGLKIIAIRGINLAVNELGSIEVDVIAPLDNHYYVGIWDESGTMSPPWDWVNDYSFWSGNIGSQKIALSAAQNYTFIFDVKPTTSSETFNFSLYKRGWFFFYLGIDNIEFNLTTNGLEANSLAKEGDENLLPVQYEAFQNYPNPFNPVTQIKYSIPERSEVTLKVYNVLGKEVATLVNEEKEPGYYTVDFDGSNLASGMYIYRITAGSFIETRKMILMK